MVRWTWREGQFLAKRTSRLVNLLLSRSPRPRTYLEIGVAEGETFLDVDAEWRFAVDPFPQKFCVPPNAKLYKMTSRSYFADQKVHGDGPFDLIFVDGLHLWEEAFEDMLSAFDHLKAGGYVVVDDVYPSGVWEGSRAENYRAAVNNAEVHGHPIVSWMGDVWKGIYILAHAGIPGLSWVTVPITQKRFHTVFWWSEPRTTHSSPLRDSLIGSHSDAVNALSTEVLGGFSYESIPLFYKVKTYGQFSSDFRNGRMQAF